MSPRTRKQFEEMREEKRTLIMDVALVHFARDGYYKTTINHIARHAGISKGLMYNYFESKEDLLTEIINRSMEEVYKYFDPDKDGYLSEEEFELFIRKLFHILREKITFWQLFYQLLMQSDVRKQLLQTILEPSDPDQEKSSVKDSFLQTVTRMLADYFMRKKERKGKEYDPILDMNMFTYTVEGFAMISISTEVIDEIYYDKAINRIIELYK
jgi:AcrR family transcriptional regulator